MSPPGLRVLSYNIHKGFSAGNLAFILERIKSSIQAVGADLVLLQEVVGHHDSSRSRIGDWPTTSQFEYLADRVWTHFAYGKNAVYTEGHHGNAILSKFPISSWENEDLSLGRLERRGLLHAAIELPGIPDSVHVLCVHLNLLERDRRVQLERLCQRAARTIPPEAPLILGGDFNDWRGSATALLREKLGLREAFESRSGKAARTFPSWFPFLRLDRLYFRGLNCRSAETAQGKIWAELSDHLPLVGEFTFGEGNSTYGRK